jgi:hypothetical protein
MEKGKGEQQPIMVVEVEKLSVLEASTKMMASLEDALPVQGVRSEPQLSGSDQLYLATQLREKEEDLEEAHKTIARDERIIQYWEGTSSPAQLRFPEINLCGGDCDCSTNRNQLQCLRPV